MTSQQSRTDPGRLDYSTMEELGEKEGDLQAFDRVTIVGLKSEKGRGLNGRLGTVVALDGENDGTANPYLARRPDGRYRVEVDFDETVGTEEAPGKMRLRPEKKTYSLKRENLQMADVGIGTLTRNPVGAAALRARGLDMRTTAEREASEPQIAGWFPAILQGDPVRTREILEYVRDTYTNRDYEVADWTIDATGDTALTGAIQQGHLEVVKVLIEFGADVNRIASLPALKELHLSYFNMAIMVIDKFRDGEAIVNALLDAGADVNSNGTKGTPLALATMIQSDHEIRMRLCRRLLAKGANPNLVMNSAPPRLGVLSQTTVLMGAASRPIGNYSEADRLELLDLLLEAGADPGIVTHVSGPSRQESCTTVHSVVSRRQPEVLRRLLSTAKGRAAVNIQRREGTPAPAGENNGDGETALTMTVGRDLQYCRANRDMAVQLLRAGADPSIKDEMGISPSMWLNDPDVAHEELKRLVKQSQGRGPSFWDSDEINAFIEGSGEDTIHQCAQCLLWTDQQQGFEGQLDFSKCSRCKSVCYCSRKCQKKHWKRHKQTCKPPS